jgi:hypothetical protein
MTKEIYLPVVIDTLMNLGHDGSPEQEFRASQVKEFLTTISQCRNANFFWKFYYTLKEQLSGKVNLKVFDEMIKILEGDDLSDIENWKAVYRYMYPHYYREKNLQEAKDLITDFFTIVLEKEPLIKAIQMGLHERETKQMPQLHGEGVHHEQQIDNHQHPDSGDNSGVFAF